MVLAKTGASMPWPVRDRRARNTYRSLHLSRAMTRQPRIEAAVNSVGKLQLDRVTLHLIVERGTLDAEQFGRLFLVAPRFCQRLENGLALQIIESLHAFARQPTDFGLL